MSRGIRSRWLPLWSIRDRSVLEGLERLDCIVMPVLSGGVEVEVLLEGFVCGG